MNIYRAAWLAAATYGGFLTLGLMAQGRSDAACIGAIACAGSVFIACLLGEQ